MGVVVPTELKPVSQAGSRFPSLGFAVVRSTTVVVWADFAVAAVAVVLLVVATGIVVLVVAAMYLYPDGLLQDNHGGNGPVLRRCSSHPDVSASAPTSSAAPSALLLLLRGYCPQRLRAV